MKASHFGLRRLPLATSSRGAAKRPRGTRQLARPPPRAGSSFEALAHARASKDEVYRNLRHGLSGRRAHQKKMVTARAHVGGHGRGWRRHHAKSEAQNDSKYDRLIRKALTHVRTDLSRVATWRGRRRMRHSVQRRALAGMARTPQFESGNVGEDTVRCKPLAPRGTGSDGSRLHRRGNIPPCLTADLILRDHR
jgi:hypothetical protein